MNPNQVLILEIIFDYAVGVPFPDEKLIPSSHLKYKKLYVNFYDKSTNKYIYGSSTIESKMSKDKQDRWEFHGDNFNNIIYVKIDKFKKK